MPQQLLSPGPSATAAELALSYQRRGWRVVPVRAGEKAPAVPDWTNFRCTEAEIPRHFQPGSNVGLITGDGLTDVDLDGGAVVLQLADVFLPPTACVFGRPGNPGSHRLYRSAEQPYFKATGPKSPDGKSKTLVELRGKGRQCLLPGSVHPSGERYEWVKDGEPGQVDARVLRLSVGKLAAAVLLIQNYPSQGARHDFALALAGALLRARWKAEDVETFISVIAAKAEDPELHDRVAAARSTAARFESGQSVTGGKSLAELLPDEVWDRIKTFLELWKVYQLQPPDDYKQEPSIEGLQPPGDRSKTPAVPLAALPGNNPRNPYDPIWQGLPPFVFWVYSKLLVHAGAAAARRTPTYRGQHVFFALQKNLAGEELGLTTLKRALMILVNKGLIEKVPLDWRRKHRDFVAANGHLGKGVKVPAYWILTPCER